MCTCYPAPGQSTQAEEKKNEDGKIIFFWSKKELAKYKNINNFSERTWPATIFDRHRLSARERENGKIKEKILWIISI